jgi:hypothetical protein
MPRSRVFWGLRYSPVPNLRTGPYRSPDQTGLQNHTSVRSQNSGPDRLQISPVRSGPSPTVRSGQSTYQPRFEISDLELLITGNY